MHSSKFLLKAQGCSKLILCFVPEHFLICMRAREKHNTDCEKNTDLFRLNKVVKSYLLVKDFIFKCCFLSFYCIFFQSEKSFVLWTKPGVWVCVAVKIEVNPMRTLAQNRQSILNGPREIRSLQHSALSFLLQ